VFGLVAAETAFGQEATTEDIVKALTPTKKLRGPRGLKIEGEERPPSINLYIPFEYDSDKLKTEAQLTLKRLGTALKDERLSGYRFQVEGHTDARGSLEYNQTLSERRAKAVRDYIVFHYDIAPDRIETMGFGKTKLLDPLKPEDGVNRRVQVINLGEQ
jgi:outer membrane protein OmpA-like peptidoglycan-associated protein